MIRYALKCAEGHGFESWFGSTGAFEALEGSGRLECPECGSPEVRKALMAPGVGSGGEAGAPMPLPERPLGHASPEVQALARLRREIEKRSDYVGSGFATEARRMHRGETPERPIYGEAAPQEARALIEDGIPVLPLPFRAGPKTN